MRRKSYDYFWSGLGCHHCYRDLFAYNCKYDDWCFHLLSLPSAAPPEEEEAEAGIQGDAND